MEKDDLQYIYKEEYADLSEVNNGMGEFIFEDLEYVENGQVIKVKAWPQQDISSFADLTYYHKHWANHKAQVYKWLDWFQDYVGGMMSVDEEWMKQNEKERWNNGELDDEKEEYDDFDDWWDQYEGSEGYYEEMSWMQQQSWDDLKNEFEWEYKVINDEIGGDWFDHYDNLNTYKMDNGLDDAFNTAEEIVEDLLNSEYDEDDFTYEELTDHFNWIFE